MRLLLEASGNLDNWVRSFSESADQPRLPLPFSCAASFVAAGHRVSLINLAEPFNTTVTKGPFDHLYGPGELRRALDENDLAFLWAASGIKATLLDRMTRNADRKVLLGSYVWNVPPNVPIKVHGLAFATKVAARFSRGVVVMTKEQESEAHRGHYNANVIKFTWGIDSGFYRTAVAQGDVACAQDEEIRELVSQPYLVLAGDQQRLDRDAVELVERFNLRVARVPQEPATAAWYRHIIAERQLRNRLFVFEHVSYRMLRYLLQNASAYVGLVDSTWQPAGWTVLCEAFASGTPAIVYEGLTVREMRSLGAEEYLQTVPHGDIAAVAKAARTIVQANIRSDLSTRSSQFARNVLDLSRTAPAFVANVETILANRQRSRPQVMLAQPGTQHSLQLAYQLDKGGALKEFYTGFTVQAGGVAERAIGKIAPAIWRKLANRTLPRLVHGKIRQRVGLELTALSRLKRGMDDQDVLHHRNERFQKSIPESALRGADLIIGVDTGSWILARQCDELGIPFVLDQTIGHPKTKQDMHEQLRAQFPDWGEGFESRNAKVWAAELIEHTAATAVVTASTFARSTLITNGVPPEKVRVIPYGVDAARFRPASVRGDRPFRFVFVGLVTARKGVPLLIEAWKNLTPSDAEIWLIGPVSRAARKAIPALKGLTLKGAVTQAEVAALLQQCDVFVFPSYFEGFGLVILEAMASGLPIITTTATAGPDVINEGQEGWVIRTGDVETLTERMEFAFQNRDHVTAMGRNARAVAETLSWEAYGERWFELLQQLHPHT